MNSDEDDFIKWWKAMLTAGDDRGQAIEAAYQQLENAGLINKVRVHQYLCAKRGHVLATVIRIGEVTVARTRGYKLAPGTNSSRSVESARRKNTLDGDRHWPGHTFDVSELAGWGPTAAIDMNCRDGLRSVRAEDILAASESSRPGHPGPPTRL